MQSANMRAWWSVVCAFAAIAAGGVLASEEPQAVEKTAGNKLYMEVLTLLDDVEGCYLVSPHGDTIEFMPEDLSGDKYDLINPIPLYGCRVVVNSVEASDAGVWELYYTKQNGGGAKEGSQYYDVSVKAQESSSSPVSEEEVTAVPSIVTLAEGSDLHVRLEKATTLFDTCVLTGPVRDDAVRDDHFVDTCGFIVRDVTPADSGIWKIEYGTETKYKATIQVTVSERLQSDNSELVWTKNQPLNETIGPEDAVYCRVENPSGLIVTEGFGRCKVVLDRVRSEHAGQWKMHVGAPGRVFVDTQTFSVKVETVTKAKVTTSVVSEKPLVMLSCQVETEHEVTACKFRDPSGKVLLASQGVGEDRYSFHGTEVSLRSEVSSRECGLRITNPEVGDLGLWRCAMETEEETYYGFLTVLCPFAMQQPAVAAVVVTEPTLTSETDAITAVEGEAVTMRCSVQSAIRYCYFRARNGTIFNVSPGAAEWYEYAGAGLDAGECSIRFPGLQASDSGRWSCHVGLDDLSAPEQRANIEVLIEAEMVAEQYQQHNQLVVRAQVHRQRALEYCRFVRIDGQGFTSQNLPSGYQGHSILTNGICEIRIGNPTILEHHPWTVVAKIVGRDLEIARSTDHTIAMPEQNPEGPGGSDHGHRGSNFVVIWSCVLIISMALFFVGVMLGPKKHRDWTYRKASSVRSSFRLSKPTEIKDEPRWDQHNSQRTAASA